MESYGYSLKLSLYGIGQGASEGIGDDGKLNELRIDS
jgi:hypothetical protein